MPKGVKAKTRTFAITDRTASSRRREENGFTMIELVTVMLILSLAMTLTIIFTGSGGIGNDLKSASRKFVAAARQARLAAVAGNKEIVFEINTKGRTLNADGFPKAVSLPEDIRLSAVTAKSEQTAGGGAGIRFFPDGGSTGGRVTLEDDDRRISIVVDWLSGRAFVEVPDDKKAGWR